METAIFEETKSKTSERPEPPPRGLRWRGGVLWINKKINGRRYQFSTGARTLHEGRKALDDFLAEHQQVPLAGSGRRLQTGRPKLPKGLYWKGRVIWVSRMVGSKHYNISTGTDDVALAKLFLDNFNVKAFKSEKLGVKSRAKITFEALANKYLEQGKLNGLRDGTIKQYSAARDRFRTFLEKRGLAGADIQSLTPAIIEDYKAWRTSTPINRNGLQVKDGIVADLPGASPKTLHCEVQAIGTFFKRGLRLGLVSENPVSKVQSVRLPDKVPVYLEEPEIKSLLEAARTFDDWAQSRFAFGFLLHDIISTYLKTGMRLDELRNLQWTDVDLTGNEMEIRQDKEVENYCEIAITPEALQVLKGYGQTEFAALDARQRQALLKNWRMGRKELEALKFSDFDVDRGVLVRRTKLKWNPKTTGRTIPIALGLKAVLERQPRGGNLVFPNPISGGLWRFNINQLIKRCAHYAKITKDIHTHTLRHTFATQLRKRGVALETIKELLGHSDIRDTLIYARYSKEEANSAIPKIDFF